MSRLLPTELTWILRATRALAPACYLEIGVWAGGTLSAVAKASPELHCVGIDDWSAAPTTGEIRARCLAAVDGLANVLLIEASSHGLMPAWAQPIGVCLIDGDHTDEGCYADLCAFAPWIARNGILVVDDVWMSEAVNAATRRWMEDEPSDSWQPLIVSDGALRWPDGSPLFKWSAWRRT